MNVFRRWTTTFFAGTALVAAILAWIVFAPVKLGGQAGYVIINGNSMEPGLHTGDLVVVRQAQEYQAGDAVLYWNVELKRYVFHRIIGIQLDRYIFQGDHNGWVDTYQPTLDELVGVWWFTIPKLGTTVIWMRAILLAVLIAAGLGGIYVAFFSKPSKQKKSKNQGSQIDWLTAVKEWATRNFSASSPIRALSAAIKPKPTEPPAGQPQGAEIKDLNNLVEAGFFLLGLLAVGSLVLAIFAFSNPLNRLVTTNVPYRHTGVYSYTATAPTGVYDAPKVQSGDPVYLKLTCQINLSFDYRLAAEQVQDVKGSYQLTARIMDRTSGWTRTIPLQPVQLFTGESFSTQAPVDLCQVQTIVDEMQKQTGVTPNTYSLVISPQVVTEGLVKGLAVKDPFAPELTFQLDHVQAYLVRMDSKQDPLKPFQDGLVSDAHSEANTLKIFGLALKVAGARALAVMGLLIALLGLAWLGVMISRTAHHDKETFVRMKYGSLLVNVLPGARPFLASAVDVASVDDLARLAERNNAMILHEVQGKMHLYRVEGDQVTYRYTMMDGPEGLDIEKQAGAVGPLDLQQAIERDEFKVYYQPIVSLLDEKIIAVEALLRWQHPTNGLISAKDFIEVAETTGLIDRMGEWMLQSACAQLTEWRQAGNPLRLAVNFSRRQLEKDPAGIIARVLVKTGLSPAALQVEIGEESLLDESGAILTNLVRLKDLGVHISVDGFSGHSSIKTLKQLPVDSIKIDRMVIEKLNQPEDVEYVQGIISAALEQGLNVVAKGVETEQQLNFLRSQLCLQAQGYLIARPAPAQELSELLQNYPTHASVDGKPGKRRVK